VFTRPPELTDAQLVDELAAHWDVRVDSLEYVALGFGSHHWRVDAGAVRWFVTVDDLDAKLRSITETRDDAFDRLHAALLTARSLRDAGKTFVVAPMPTIRGDIVRRVGDRFVAALYPHIDGRTHAWGEFTSRADRLAVLDMVVGVHDASPGDRAATRTEDFMLSNRDDLDLALDDLRQPWDGGPFAELARTLLDVNARDIARMLSRYDRLADDARLRPDRMVVTHGEPHIGNTIETDDGWMLVDWDTALRAPPERDLWTIAKGDATIIDDYVHRTGRPVLSSALDLYRLAWDVAEIAIYTALFRRAHDDSADVRESYKNLAVSIDAGRRQTGSTDNT
jgi:hypothetical protein